MGNCSLTAVADTAHGTNILRLHEEGRQRQEGKVRTSSGSACNRFQTINGKTSVEVLTPPGNGVWKVKLLIDPKDLEQILSEQVNTEALIEQMRIAANSTPRRGKSSRSRVSGSHLSRMCSF